MCRSSSPITASILTSFAAGNGPTFEDPSAEEISNRPADVSLSVQSLLRTVNSSRLADRTGERLVSLLISDVSLQKSCLLVGRRCQEAASIRQRRNDCQIVVLALRSFNSRLRRSNRSASSTAALFANSTAAKRGSVMSRVIFTTL